MRFFFFSLITMALCHATILPAQTAHWWSDLPTPLPLLPRTATQQRANLHSQLGQHALAATDTALALQHYAQAATLRPHSPRMLRNYASLLHSFGQHQAAIEGTYRYWQLDVTNEQAITMFQTLGLSSTYPFERLIAEGKATPIAIKAYIELLASTTQFDRYYDVLFAHLHQLDEQTILPNDYIIGDPSLAIHKLASLRHKAKQKGQLVAMRTFTYWLGRYCYAAQRYTEAAEYLSSFPEAYTRVINSYYYTYQFTQADSVLMVHSLPHIGYIASPLAPYIKLWLGDTTAAIRLAEQQVGLNTTHYATAVNDNIIFPQTLFNIYAATGHTTDALRLLLIRQTYNNYSGDLSAVGNLPLLHGYIQLGRIEHATTLAEAIVADATPFTSVNWGYSYPMVLLLANAPATAATEFAILTSDSTLTSPEYLPLMGYHCGLGNYEAALTLLEQHTHLPPATALALFTTPLYQPLLELPRTQVFLQKHIPPTALQRLAMLRLKR